MQLPTTTSITVPCSLLRPQGRLCGASMLCDVERSMPTCAAEVGIDPRCNHLLDLV